jgi:hypothetical protein
LLEVFIRILYTESVFCKDEFREDPMAVTVSRFRDDLVESGLYNCPLGLAPTIDPVIDRCGHTYDLAYIKQVYERALARGQPLLCPISREPIVFDELIPNRALKESEESTKKVLGDFSLILQALEQQNILTTNCIEALTQTNQRLHGSMQRLEAQVGNLTNALTVQNMRINNVATMSFLDKIALMLGLKSPQEILDKNIPSHALPAPQNGRTITIAK